MTRVERQAAARKRRAELKVAWGERILTLMKTLPYKEAADRLAEEVARQAMREPQRKAEIIEVWGLFWGDIRKRVAELDGEE